MSWTNTRARIGYIKRDNPEADVSALLAQMKREKAEEDITKLVRAGVITPDDLVRVAQSLVGGDEA